MSTRFAAPSEDPRPVPPSGPAAHPVRLETSEAAVAACLGGAETIHRLAGRVHTHPEPISGRRLLPLLEVGHLADALPVMAALERLGEHAAAARLLAAYPRLQRRGGEFRSGSPRRWEETGCALWTLVDHARLTGDLDYLKACYPALRRGVRWLGGRRSPDGAQAHSGLMPAADAPEGPGERYPASLWSLAGIQEAARAAAVLGRRGHQHHGEALYIELSRAIRRSLQEPGEEGEGGRLLPGTAPGHLEAAGRSLAALQSGDLYPPGFEPVLRAAEAAYQNRSALPVHGRITLAHLLLQQGDPRVWSVVEELAAAGPPGAAADRGALVWLARNLLLLDNRQMLLLAPGAGLRMPAEEDRIEVEAAPSLWGPITYTLERRGAWLSLEWAPLRHEAPAYLLWPLPGRLHRCDPPAVRLTDSRRSVYLDPAGGRLRVQPAFTHAPGGERAPASGNGDGYR